jgi:dynein heavy chain
MRSFIFKNLCKRGAELLEAKSARVEEAANELITMLLEIEEEEKVDKYSDDSDEDFDKKDTDKDTEKLDRQSSTPRTGSSRPGSRANAGSRLGSAVISPAAAAAKRKREMRDYLAEEAQELLSYFNHRNVDAIVRVIRTTLDSTRRRVAASAAHHFVSSPSQFGKENNNALTPLFKAYVTLQIPNITMQPALDEIQQALNKAAQYVVSVSKGVSLWNKTCKALTKPEKKDDSDNEENRSRSASNVGSDDDSRSDTAPIRRSGRMQADSDAGTVVSMAFFPQKANYFKNVSENKEVAKLVSMLSTVVNSQKKEVMTALEIFSNYQIIWKGDREQTIKDFLKNDPKLSEFEAQILHYKELERRILLEPESYSIGAIAIVTGKAA